MAFPQERQRAFVRSAAFSSAKVKTLLDDLKGITAGTFSATIGGTAVSLSEVDLSGSDSISAALDIVTKKIAAVEEPLPPQPASPSRGTLRSGLSL